MIVIGGRILEFMVVSLIFYEESNPFDEQLEYIQYINVQRLTWLIDYLS